MKKFNALRALRARGAQAALAAGAMVMAASARAADGAGIDSLFDGVDLSGIFAKVLAMAAVIVTIALVIKGPSIVKRIIAKI